MSAVATKVKVLEAFMGDAALYALYPPMIDDDGSFEYVAVSAVEVLGEPETYIFPADADGNVTSWGELHGSVRGTLSHGEALSGAGYEIAKVAP